MDNTLSNIMFIEPINKSDHTGFQQRENFPDETIKWYSIKEWLRK